MLTSLLVYWLVHAPVIWIRVRAKAGFDSPTESSGRVSYVPFDFVGLVKSGWLHVVVEENFSHHVDHMRYVGH